MFSLRSNGSLRSPGLAGGAARPLHPRGRVATLLAAAPSPARALP